MIVHLTTTQTIPVYVEVDTEAEKVTKVRYAWDEQEIGVLSIEPEDSEIDSDILWAAVNIGHTKTWPAGTEE